MLTLTQLSKLAENENIDMWGGLQLPADSPMDRDVLINSILEHCGLNIPVYADPFVMSNAIALWSAKNQYTFEHVGKIYEASYSPIENYDRYEDMSTDHSRNLKDDTSSSSKKTEKLDTTSNSSEKRTTEHSGTDSTTDESQTSAYDSSSYQPENLNTSNITHGEIIGETGSADTKGNSNKGTDTSSKVNKGVNETEKTTQKNHIRGNIGVTTAMAMEREEMDYIANYNPYTFLSGLFENELTLFVY